MIPDTCAICGCFWFSESLADYKCNILFTECSWTATESTQAIRSNKKTTRSIACCHSFSAFVAKNWQLLTAKRNITATYSCSENGKRWSKMDSLFSFLVLKAIPNFSPKCAATITYRDMYYNLQNFISWSSASPEREGQICSCLKCLTWRGNPTWKRKSTPLLKAWPVGPLWRCC